MFVEDYMLRILWVYLNAVLYVLFHIIPIRRRYKHPKRYSIDEKFKHARKVGQIVTERSGVDVTVLGREHLLKDQAVLYVSNHASMIDPYFACYAIEHQFGAVIAGDAGYEKIPVVSPWFQSFGSVYVNRENPRDAIKGINQAIKNVKAGQSLLLYPEGEITSYVTNDDSVAPFHTGGLKIAIKGEIPIIPIAMIGTEKIFKARSIIGRMRKGKIVIKILEPYTKHLNEDVKLHDLAEDLRQLIKKEVDQGISFYSCNK